MLILFFSKRNNYYFFNKISKYINKGLLITFKFLLLHVYARKLKNFFLYTILSFSGFDFYFLVDLFDLFDLEYYLTPPDSPDRMPSPEPNQSHLSNNDQSSYTAATVEENRAPSPTDNENSTFLSETQVIDRVNKNAEILEHGTLEEAHKALADSQELYNKYPQYVDPEQIADHERFVFNRTMEENGQMPTPNGSRENSPVPNIESELNNFNNKNNDNQGPKETPGAGPSRRPYTGS